VSTRRGFASDNAATIHPEVLAAIAAANVGHAFGYGHDPYTQSVERRFEETFGEGSHTFFVFNGTGANILCLRAVCRPWHAVICSEWAHLNVDESAAPESVAGVKLLVAPAPDAKLTPATIEAFAGRLGDEHAAQPRVVSVTQPTELGTVYSGDELRAIAEVTHARGMLLHMDGARLSNAAAALGCSLRETSFDVGIDLLSFGGTKCGLMFGEAVVVRDAALAADLLFLRKASMQLASKMRFLAAQFDALLAGELWRRSAAHANAMAQLLAGEIGALPGITITQPVQASAVFAIIPPDARAALLERFDFYVWDEARDEVRWMCSWDTTPEDVEAFAAAVAECLLVCK
jgi:threonine aldolase